MTRQLLVATTAIGALCMGGPSLATDVQAGRSVAEAKCGQCHRANDWEGEDAPSLQDLIRDIVAGKVKHKGKLDLSPDEIASISAYWAEGGKKKKK